MFGYDDDLEMTDEELLEFIDSSKISPKTYSGYEQRYLSLYNKFKQGLNFDREQAEFLQKQLLRRGSHFAVYHRIFPNE